MNKYSYKGKVITADSKKDAIQQILAFSPDRISDSTMALFETMNEGSFQYNYRTNDNFKQFVETTLKDEVEDVIRSDKNLIRKCIEKRVKAHSIVWQALYQIFNFVKKSNGLRAIVDNEKIKNWFAFNNTNYKTALKPIVDYIEESFRPELRETEKPVTAGLKTIQGRVKELCALCKKDKKIADIVIKALTKDYNTSLDCVLASRYLKNKWMSELENLKGWVDWSTAMNRLYEKLGADFVCTVLNDMKSGDSNLSGGASNTIITDIYNMITK